MNVCKSLGHSWTQYWDYDTPSRPVPGKQICGLCCIVRVIYMDLSAEDVMWDE